MNKLAALLVVVPLVAACEREVPHGAESATLADFKPKEVVRPSMDAMRYYAQAASRMRPAEDQLKDFNARVAAGLVLSPAARQVLDDLRAAIEKARPLLAPLTAMGALQWEKQRDAAEPAVQAVERLAKVLSETP